MKWFDDSKGWKSKAGGFSDVQQITTDALFVRKFGGAAALAFHLQKIIPLIFQRGDTHWGR